MITKKTPVSCDGRNGRWDLRLSSNSNNLSAAVNFMLIIMVLLVHFEKHTRNSRRSSQEMKASSVSCAR